MRRGEKLRRFEGSVIRVDIHWLANGSTRIDVDNRGRFRILFKIFRKGCSVVWAPARENAEQKKVGLCIGYLACYKVGAQKRLREGCNPQNRRKKIIRVT